MSDIIFSGSYKPLTEQEVSQFEEWLEARLPSCYRNFLFENNGGFPHRHLIPGPCGCYLMAFYAISSNAKRLSLANAIKLFRDDLERGLIPIAYSGTGDQICVSLIDERIYLWQHDRDYDSYPASLEELIVIAENINDLLIMLEGDEAPVIDDEISNLARWGDIQLLKEYLSRKNSVNSRSARGGTLVGRAAKEGYLEFIKECVNHGAVLRGSGALHGAIIDQNYEVVKYLLEQCADPNEINESGETPLDWAVGPSPAVDLLISHGGRASM